MPTRDWELMFKGAQSIAQSSVSISDGLRQLMVFAAAHSAQYDEPDYWKRIESGEFPSDTLVSWAADGLEKLEPFEGWSLVMLDAGDCPDTFYLAESRFAHVMDDFFHHANSKVVVSADEFPPMAFDQRHDLAMHGLDELNHPILSYHLFDKHWHGANGELLWLGLVTLALCQPLRDTQFCRRILQGRKQILLMSGFEEIFFYLGKVTGAGLTFD
jgi:hypothetical protein